MKIALADPHGAALYSFYTTGVLKSEGSSITEGIGQGRITANLEGAPVDFAYRIDDEEAVRIVFDLVEHEGLLLGGSSGVNIAGAIRLARELGPGTADRHGAVQFRRALRLQAVQPGIPAREEPARAGLADAEAERAGRPPLERLGQRRLLAHLDVDARIVDFVSSRTRRMITASGRSFSRSCAMTPM